MQVEVENGDVVWGARAIGQILGLNERQAYHRLEQGHIACARKFGNTWAARKVALHRLFEHEAAE